MNEKIKITINQVRNLFDLSLIDEQIAPHLKRAKNDFKNINFVSDFDELEAITCKCVYYLAVLLWVKMQNKADEYQESLQSFNDVKDFQSYWLKRANDSVPKDANIGAIKCQVI